MSDAKLLLAEVLLAMVGPVQATEDPRYVSCTMTLEGASDAQIRRNTGANHEREYVLPTWYYFLPLYVVQGVYTLELYQGRWRSRITRTASTFALRADANVCVKNLLRDHVAMDQWMRTHIGYERKIDHGYYNMEYDLEMAQDQQTYKNNLHQHNMEDGDLDMHDN